MSDSGRRSCSAPNRIRFWKNFWRYCMSFYHFLWRGFCRQSSFFCFRSLIDSSFSPVIKTVSVLTF